MLASLEPLLSGFSGQSTSGFAEMTQRMQLCPVAYITQAVMSTLLMCIRVACCASIYDSVIFVLCAHHWTPCRRQALDFFFTYFHLNYEESLIPPGKTIQELAAVAPGPKNSQGKFLWNMQAYALDPAGDLPSLQRLCNSFGCSDLSPGQIPVYIGGYQLQIQQPFTAVGLLLPLRINEQC